MFETSHPRIEHALEIVDREITYATVEKRAFRQFCKRVQRIDPSVPTRQTAAVGMGGDTMALAGGEQSTGTTLHTVRTAYRETVMAVPHFDAEYDETLSQNVDGEFGADLAAQVVDGTHLTPTLQEALIAAGQRGIEERTRFLEALRTERDSLRDVQATLDDYEQRAQRLREKVGQASDSGELASLDDQLQTLEAEAEALATSRQQFIHTRTAGALAGVDETSLVRFLYDECDVAFPALAEITACLETIRRHRQRCLR